MLNYKELQTITAMITDDKVTELFCMADDFRKFFDAMMTKYTLKPDKKWNCHSILIMSRAEIMILFHASGYRCLKHFYQGKVCMHLRHLSCKLSRTTSLWSFRRGWRLLRSKAPRPLGSVSVLSSRTCFLRRSPPTGAFAGYASGP